MTDLFSFRKSVLFKKFLLAGVLTLIPLLLFDMALRFWIGQLPRGAQNLLLSRYFVGRDGIYFRETRWNMHVMKPDYRARMFYNGYRWNHQTNARGIREGRDFDRASMVLLGDSQIYGHGLEVPQTISENLTRLTGQKAVNLGIQGDYPPFQFLRLRELGLFYQPKLVLLFTEFDQDMDDYRTMRPDEAYINRILTEPAPDYAGGFRASRYLEAYRPDRWESVSGGFKAWFPSLRVLHFARAFSQWRFTAAPAAGETAQEKGDWNSIPFLSRTFTRFLEAGDTLCRARGARLAVIVHAQTHTQAELRDQVREFCRTHGIPYLELRPFFEKRADVKELFLAGDGHYSVRGAALAAETVRDFLQAQGLLPQASGAAA